MFYCVQKYGMYSPTSVVFFALLISCCSDANSEELSPQQEQEIVKHIEHEILGCEVHDRDTLNKCLVKLTDLIRPYMRYGIKFWAVPVLEPMFLKNVKITQKPGSLPLKGHFKDVLVYGLSNFKVDYLRTIPEKYSFSFGLKFPELRMMGYYDIDGKLLLLELKDHGPFTANFTKVDSKVECQFKVINGILHLHEAKSDFRFKKMRFHLDNLLQGSAIGESVNESLNESVNELLAEFKPGFIKEINRIIVQTLQQGLRNLPLSKWQAAFIH